MTPAEVAARLGGLVERAGGGPDGWQERMATYANLLAETNRQINLVSRRAAEDLLGSQLVPCLAILDLFPPDSTLRVLDAGTGGGLPGIPLQILRPHIRLDLVDATRKKVRFVEEALSALGLKGSCAHHCRIEAPTAALLDRAPFDRVVSRSMGGRPALIGGTQPLLAPKGELWVFANPTDPHVRPWSETDGTVRTGLLRLIPAHPKSSQTHPE
ncbi:MAG: class I SAM-dependent methyltransferase [Gemmatimonadota bacterium]|nr:hypothetical protein [Gemmatimonadota bacterium]MDP6529479.1 class I SAM-dependent methyltransferase [Gemmatimonadota bacterium]